MIRRREGGSARGDHSDYKNYFVSSFDHLAEPIFVQHVVEVAGPPAPFGYNAPSGWLSDQVCITARVLLDDRFSPTAKAFCIRDYVIASEDLRCEGHRRPPR